MSTSLERMFIEQAPGLGSCWVVTDLVLEKDKKEAHSSYDKVQPIMEKRVERVKAIGLYCIMPLFPKLRIVAPGLIFHMLTDWQDCLWMS